MTVIITKRITGNFQKKKKIRKEFFFISLHCPLFYQQPQLLCKKYFERCLPLETLEILFRPTSNFSKCRSGSKTSVFKAAKRLSRSTSSVSVLLNPLKDPLRITATRDRSIDNILGVIST